MGCNSILLMCKCVFINLLDIELIKFDLRQGTRLILNVREANCKLTRSIYTGPEFSMLRFQHTRREDEYSQNVLGGAMEEA